jgi:peptidoglycan/xylan/chitin deacetylase (PgdA/CDA1 family)
MDRDRPRRPSSRAADHDDPPWDDEPRWDDEPDWDDGWSAGPPDPRGDETGGWQPYPQRRTPLWQTARLAGLLAVALVALVVVALVLPGVDLPAATPTPPASGPTGTGIAGGPTPSVDATFVRPTPTPQPTFLSYLVEAGDNLGTIARRFETTARSIAFWNRETYPSLDPYSEGYEPNRIEIGWRLRLIPGAVFDEDDAPPTPSPGAATPTPTPAATAPTGGGPATVVSAGPRGTDEIALTFDMGGRLDPAVDLVIWLVDHDVAATIFPTGKQAAEQEQGRAAMAIVGQHPELFELGNHSWDHPDFTGLSAEQIASQLDRAEAAVVGITGRSTRPYFRPPFGAWNRGVRDAVGAAGWSRLVLWDVDTIDWRPTSDGGPTAADIETKVVANAEGGSIVLMHLGGWNTLEALPGIIAGLEERGLRPVTLTDLLGG